MRYEPSWPVQPVIRALGMVIKFRKCLEVRLSRVGPAI